MEENAYHTLERARLVLADGTEVDTGAPDADARLGGVGRELLALRQRVLASSALTERIRRRYRQKNTTGYSLNALVDFETPARILEHLVVGSEGTLAFIAEAVLRTVPEPRFRATGLLLFPSLQAAGAAVDVFARSGARAVEIMDRACLRAVAGRPGVPPGLNEVPSSAAALLVEYQVETEAELEEAHVVASRTCAGLPLLLPARFTSDAAGRAALWQVRKGLFPAVGAARPTGTTVIIEDVAVPRERLAEAITELRSLFDAHGYAEGIVFGHARDGNLHFVVTQSFREEAEVRRYERFMADVVRMVVERFDGALKAEHGTGRNMAPFVETEWGAEAYAVMREVKALLDPDGVLNPGVILNDDPKAHLRHLKRWPTVEEEVDRCIECGFCESVCPTRDSTTTPRQRIVVRRELARLREEGGNAALRATLEAAYAWQAVDSCATDGMCATACPVDIDTGALMKRLRAERHGRLSRAIAVWVARHFDWMERLMRALLQLGHAAEAMVGPRVLGALTGLVGPRWSSAIPHPAPRRLAAGVPEAEADVVYFPSCATRLLGKPRGAEAPLPEVLLELGRRAGVRITVPRPVMG
ncbi:MAG: 4Fe-4S dicluster domain-containing protein, partial [Myxococcaceae bacterium]|nr:4Fe-4S dicluster domain-containing protein [Myxococcaceae bacterium]